MHYEPLDGVSRLFKGFFWAGACARLSVVARTHTHTPVPAPTKVGGACCWRVVGFSARALSLSPTQVGGACLLA